MGALTILCMPVSAVGHTNATLGLALALKRKGHKVVFALDKSWEGKVSKFGFEEQIYEDSETIDKEAGQQWSEALSEFEELVQKSDCLAILNTVETFLMKMFHFCKRINQKLETIVSTVKPDVIIEDYMVPIPAFFASRVPCISLYSTNPLFMYDDDRLPPFGCGLPLHDKIDWERCRQVAQKTKIPYVPLLNEWKDEDYPQLPKLPTSRMYKSTNLNIIMYPKAALIDYENLCPLGEEYINVDHCLRQPFGDFQMPEKFRNRPGKLIFLSLGSMGSSFVLLMKRLIKILEKSEHKFIVSLGHRHKEYTLAENMWGDEFVPQLAVLPHVDLVLTHGGNNSFTETLYFGKPMIVLPLVGDQNDNAQRAVELNIGLRFNPFKVTEIELNDAINSVLSDNTIAENVQRISKGMQESNSLDKAVEKIEFIAMHPKFPMHPK